jgi:hypothetical protein
MQHLSRIDNSIGAQNRRTKGKAMANKQGKVEAITSILVGFAILVTASLPILLMTCDVLGFPLVAIEQGIALSQMASKVSIVALAVLAAICPALLIVFGIRELLTRKNTP